MSYRVDRTLADFIAGALSPPLIMGLVGSLVFFLQEILYQGMYSGVLRWVLFFFVFGAVLIARISMAEDMGKAGMYGLVLGGLVWLALQMYVDYSDNPALAGQAGFINLGLIALIWWSAHKLTWDCTLVDDDEANEGIGLLDAAGLDQKDKAHGLPSVGLAEGAKKPKKERPGLEGWWDRFGRYRAKRRSKPRTPGVWVVVFSLAALPLFGLGQTLLPAADVARRHHAFALLVVYVGCGLALLLTTSFLGMRGYLRQRKVTMPVTIAVVWLLFGGLLIGLLLGVGNLMPRPDESQWEWAGSAGSRQLEPSRLSPFEAKDGDKPGGKGAAQTKDKSSSGKSASKGGDDNQAKGGGGSQAKGAKGSTDRKDKSGIESDKRDGARPTEKPNAPAPPRASPPPAVPGFVPPFLAPLLVFLIVVVKWIVIVLVVGAVSFFVLRGLLQFLANFTFWAQRLLALFASLWPTRQSASGGPARAEQPEVPPRPFSSFANPFSDGRAEYLSAAELVRYSFAAWQAWGRDRELARDPGETIGEYARRTAKAHPELGDEAGKLAVLYGRLAYSTDSLSPADGQSLRAFWQMLTRLARNEEPLELAAQ